MNRRMSIGEFLGCLIDHVEAKTGVKCYDFPDNVPSPLYSVEIESTEDAKTKTMYLDVYNVLIHCVSEPVEPYSNAPVLRLEQKLEEAMTEDVALPAPFFLNDQSFAGLRDIKRDESGEGHAVVSYRFEVCYGYLCK